MEKKVRNGIVLAMVAVIVVGLLLLASMGLMGTKNGGTGAKLDVVSVKVDRQNVLINDSVNVTVTMRNEGTERGVKTISLLVDRDMNESKNISLEAGGVQTVYFTVRSPTAGNHTITCEGNSTSFTSYPRWKVGDYTTYRYVSNVEGASNMTLTVVAVNDLKITFTRSFDDGVRTNSTDIADTSINTYTILTNLSLVGKVDYVTHFGNKILSHYNRTDPSPMYDVYWDEPSQLVFRQVTSAWPNPNLYPYVITEELIGTNMPWVQDLARA